jgi:UDP-N-acetylmuramoylalanine--D-glutamate ligase
LNTYQGMEDYAEAKAQIFRHQKPKDIVILNADDAYGKRWIKEAGSVVQTFGGSRKNGASYHGDDLYLAGKELIDARKMKLIGEHNIKNALAASLAARAVGASTVAIRKALTSFKPLENRLELVRSVKEVAWINDTCATTPDGAIAVYQTLKSRHELLLFIMGGADKVLDYTELADTFAKAKGQVSALVLPGDASDKLIKEFVKREIAFERVPDMKTAVARASALAMKGDAVVLSPAAASFGLFKNEFDRGEQFVKGVRELK